MLTGNINEIVVFDTLLLFFYYFHE